MNAKRCDRCGNYYQEQFKYPYKVRFEYPNNNLLFVSIKAREFDVCPSCMEQLNEWFDKLDKSLIIELGDK